MAKPQQPEIARSGRGATDPAAIKSELSVPVKGGPAGDAGPLPEDNVPGHHPTEEQDRPTGAAFLEKLHEHATEGEPDSATERWDAPEPTMAGEALRAAAGAVRKVRESLPGDD